MTIVMVMMSAPGMARRSSFGAREYDDGSHCTLSSKTLHKFPKHPQNFKAKNNCEDCKNNPNFRYLSPKQSSCFIPFLPPKITSI